MTITIAGWIIPLIITVCGCGYALFLHDDGGGIGGGIGNLVLLVPALLVSMVAWIIWGVFS